MIPDRRRRRASLEGLLPEDRLPWAKGIWLDREAIAKEHSGAWLLREAGKLVCIQSGVEERDYTPGREATGKVKQLLQDGAVTWHALTDLLDALQSQSKKEGMLR